MIEFAVYGHAQGKGRPRFARRGNFVQTYTDKKTKTYEDLVKYTFLETKQPIYEAEKPLVLEIDVQLMPPKSTPKYKIVQMLAKKLFPTKKPDLDNYIKSIQDALNKVAFYDDSQIVVIIARKFYGEIEYQRIKIREVEELDVN